MDEKIKLNIGGGKAEWPGYRNIDRQNGKEAFPLPEDILDESCDEIRASHILEHFPHFQAQDVVNHWTKKLKIGGVMKIAVPDLDYVVDEYRKNNPECNVNGWLMGGQIDENDIHRCLLNYDTLKDIMQKAGLSDIQKWTDEIKDSHLLPVSLNLCGIKSAAIAERPKEANLRVIGVMTQPRLGFTDNASCMYTEMGGIKVKIVHGVYWNECLTRGIIEALREDAPDRIFTLDYDTWFRREHVVRMLQLMEMNPDADAIIPVQCKREDVGPMVGILDKRGKSMAEVPASYFDKDLVRCVTGHFGLTLFRTSCFAKLKKPWFKAYPGKNNDYGTDRRDADIEFWWNFKRSGCKAYLAPNVMIGHLQMLCTFPSRPSEGYRPQHFYMKDVQNLRIPSYLIPRT